MSAADMDLQDEMLDLVGNENEEKPKPEVDDAITISDDASLSPAKGEYHNADDETSPPVPNVSVPSDKSYCVKCAKVLPISWFASFIQKDKPLKIAKRCLVCRGHHHSPSTKSLDGAQRFLKKFLRENLDKLRGSMKVVNTNNQEVDCDFTEEDYAAVKQGLIDMLVGKLKWNKAIIDGKVAKEKLQACLDDPDTPECGPQSLEALKRGSAKKRKATVDLTSPTDPKTSERPPKIFKSFDRDLTRHVPGSFLTAFQYQSPTQTRRDLAAMDHQPPFSAPSQQGFTLANRPSAFPTPPHHGFTAINKRTATPTPEDRSFKAINNIPANMTTAQYTALHVLPQKRKTNAASAATPASSHAKTKDLRNIVNASADAFDALLNKMKGLDASHPAQVLLVQFNPTVARLTRMSVDLVVLKENADASALGAFDPANMFGNLEWWVLILRAVVRKDTMEAMVDMMDLARHADEARRLTRMLEDSDWLLSP